MKTESILIENLKCKGCASTIKNSIASLLGVNDVSLDNDHFNITVKYDDHIISHQDIAQKLASIGYPEVGDSNSLLTKAKSYVSCAIGRLNPQEN